MSKNPLKKRYSEEAVLKILDIPDFRHLTKDKAIEFVSMIPQMDPEVAIKALEQFPQLKEVWQKNTKKQWLKLLTQITTMQRRCMRQ